jgi:hypothetical protein
MISIYSKETTSVEVELRDCHCAKYLYKKLVRFFGSTKFETAPTNHRFATKFFRHVDAVGDDPENLRRLQLTAESRRVGGLISEAWDIRQGNRYPP